MLGMESDRRFQRGVINEFCDDKGVGMNESITFKCEPIDDETIKKIWGNSTFEIQNAKADDGKLRLSLVPMQIVKDIAEVRMFGVRKYSDPDNWKRVEKNRYIDALLRHLLEYLEDPKSVDEESGLPHWKHFVTNAAFISYFEEQERRGENGI